MVKKYMGFSVNYLFRWRHLYGKMTDDIDVQSVQYQFLFLFYDLELPCMLNVT